MRGAPVVPVDILITEPDEALLTLKMKIMGGALAGQAVFNVMPSLVDQRDNFLR